MSTPVESAPASLTVGEARALMKRKDLHHLVVLAGGAVAGLISARDLIGVRTSERVDQVMTARVVSTGPRTSVRQAANLMRGRALGCLPVVEDGQLLGIVTVADLLALIGRGVERPVERTTPWTLRGRGPRKRRPTDDRQGLAYSR